MFVIVGESGSGKSSLVQSWCAKHPNYERVVTYTTRPKRENEVDGKDYHFVDKTQFDKMKRGGEFVEYNSYNGWSYGTKLDYGDNTYKIVVLTPAGLRALKRKGIKHTSVYLYVDRRSRLNKLLNRGDDIEEAYRRNLSDVGQFDAISEEVDHIIDNFQYRHSVDKMVEKFGNIVVATQNKIDLSTEGNI